jgi:hypothetical protein
VDISHGRVMEDDRNAKKSEEKDGISKFFENLFGSDDKDSRRYSNAARTSNSIVTVHAHTQEEAQKAAEILDHAGAEDVDDMASRYESDEMGQRSGMHTGERFEAGHDRQQDARHQEMRDRNDEKSIPVIKEDVNIGKRQVETSGSVRIRSRIVERPVEENLRLREEHVRVERRKVDRPVTDADRRNFKEGTTEFVERKEVPVVNKSSRVVEEIHMSKQVKENQQTIRDKERKTEVDVEKLHRGQGNDPTNRDRDQGSDTTGRNTGLGNDPTTRRK